MSPENKGNLSNSLQNNSANLKNNFGNKTEKNFQSAGNLQFHKNTKGGYTGNQPAERNIGRSYESSSKNALGGKKTSGALQNSMPRAETAPQNKAKQSSGGTTKGSTPFFTKGNTKLPAVRNEPKTILKDIKPSSRTGLAKGDIDLAKTNGPNKVQKEVAPSVKVYFLGGLNEIGKNITVFEYENDMILVDCGMAFPDDELLGVDLVIPDFTFIENNAHKIKGLILTHGHEDHIGSIPYLLKKLNVPIYGTPLTIGLVSVRLKEHNLLNKAKLNVIKPGSTVKLGKFSCEFIRVNHSIPDAVAFAISTPAGLVIHTGDFKIDSTPTQGKMMDIGRFAELSKQGVLALLADSTNAENPGYTITEQSVRETFEKLFLDAEGRRIIVASFASNVGRIQQIINCAVKYKRKVAISGRSMLNYVGIAKELGYLEIPEGTLVELDLVKKLSRGEVVLITTGSQGEPMSALTRMAYADHRQVEIAPGDFVIISATPIPGNEKTVGAVINELMKRECTVVYGSMHKVHVSGHACQEELKLIQAIVNPKYFIPVHGEQRHLRSHANLAKSLGMSEKNIFIGDVGDALELNKNYMKKLGKIPAGRILVDGLGVGDVGNIVLKDRKHLSEDGLIAVVCAIDSSSGAVVSGPDIVSRGFVYVRENESLMDEAKKVVIKTLENCQADKRQDWSMIKTKVKEGLSRFIYEKTKRRPMILPIVMEI